MRAYTIVCKHSAWCLNLTHIECQGVWLLLGWHSWSNIGKSNYECTKDQWEVIFCSSFYNIASIYWSARDRHRILTYSCRVTALWLTNLYGTSFLAAARDIEFLLTCQWIILTSLSLIQRWSLSHIINKCTTFIRMSNC